MEDIEEFDNNYNNINNSNQRRISIVLAILLIASFIYIYKISTDIDIANLELNDSISVKEKTLSDLEKLKNTYDSLITEKTSLSEELTKEKEKIEKLLIEIENSKGDIVSMSKYKMEYIKLKNDMAILLAENNRLKEENIIAIKQRDSTAIILSKTEKINQELTKKVDETTKIIEKATKLVILNLKTSAYKVKGSGKQIETEKAKSADILKISFTIAENRVAKSDDKIYFIQIIDSKNNILGEKKSEKFDDKLLTYSFMVNVKFENKTVQVSQNLEGKNFEKGTYFVNIFDKSELVSTTSFVLK